MPKFNAADVDARLSVCDLTASSTARPEHKSGIRACKKNIEGCHSVLANGKILSEAAVPSSQDGYHLRFLGPDKNVPFLMVKVGAPRTTRCDAMRIQSGKSKSPKGPGLDSAASQVGKPSTPMANKYQEHSSSASTFKDQRDSSALGGSVQEANHKHSKAQGNGTALTGFTDSCKASMETSNASFSSDTAVVTTPSTTLIETAPAHKALALCIKLGPRSSRRSNNSNDAQDLKLDVFINGTFAATSFMPSRSNALTLSEGFIVSGSRVDRLLERAWLLAKPCQQRPTIDIEAQLQEDRLTIARRWHAICTALRHEAFTYGVNSSERRPPLADYLTSLSEMDVPETLFDHRSSETMQLSVIDAIISLGEGKKYNTKAGYLDTAHKMEDSRYLDHTSTLPRQSLTPGSKELHWSLDTVDCSTRSAFPTQASPQQYAKTSPTFSGGSRSYTPVSTDFNQRLTSSPLGFLDAARDADVTHSGAGNDDPSPIKTRRRNFCLPLSGPRNPTQGSSHSGLSNPFRDITPARGNHTLATITSVPQTLSLPAESPSNQFQQCLQSPTKPRNEKAANISPSLEGEKGKLVISLPKARAMSKQSFDTESKRGSILPLAQPSPTRELSSIKRAGILVKRITVFAGPNNVKFTRQIAPCRIATTKKASLLSPIQRVARRPSTPSAFGRAELGTPKTTFAGPDLPTGQSAVHGQKVRSMTTRQQILALRKGEVPVVPSSGPCCYPLQHSGLPRSSSSTSQTRGRSDSNDPLMPPPPPKLSGSQSPSQLLGIDLIPSQQKDITPAVPLFTPDTIPTRSKTQLSQLPSLTTCPTRPARQARPGHTCHSTSFTSEPPPKRRATDSSVPRSGLYDYNNQDVPVSPRSTRQGDMKEEFVVPETSVNSVVTYSGKLPDQRTVRHEGLNVRTRGQDKKEEEEREEQLRRQMDKRKGKMETKDSKAEMYGVRQIKAERTGEFRESEVLVAVRFLVPEGAGWTAEELEL